LGLEQQRWGYQGSVNSDWYLTRPRAEFSVESDRVGSVYFLRALVRDRDLGRVRIALPGRLSIGGSTMGDVIRRLGPPVKQHRDYVETEVIYSYDYFLGPEGTYKQTYSVVTTIGSARDPLRGGPPGPQRPRGVHKRGRLAV
jgi:hypothetical protein